PEAFHAQLHGGRRRKPAASLFAGYLAVPADKDEPMTQLLERAPEADTSALDHVNHWIDGQRVAGTSGRSGPVYDPATGRLARRVDFAAVEEVDAAVAAAKRAFPSWRATSLSKRTEILFRIRNLVEEHRA